MMQYHLLRLRSSYIQSEQPTLDLPQKVQLTGDGVVKATRGRYIGLTFHQLLQAVKN